jgi:uncharacterized membrane protein
MSDAEDVVGPIDFLLLEFDPAKATGEAGAALMDLVDAGIVRIYDLVIIEKAADGSVSGVELTDLQQGSLGGFSAFAGARSGLVGDEDIANAGEGLQDGSAAALIVYENAWAAPFVAAARRSGAEVVASARIPADLVNEALDAMDAAEPVG